MNFANRFRRAGECVGSSVASRASTALVQLDWWIHQLSISILPVVVIHACGTDKDGSVHYRTCTFRSFDIGHFSQWLLTLPEFAARLFFDRTNLQHLRLYGCGDCTCALAGLWMHLDGVCSTAPEWLVS